MTGVDVEEVAAYRILFICHEEAYKRLQCQRKTAHVYHPVSIPVVERTSSQVAESERTITPIGRTAFLERISARSFSGPLDVMALVSALERVISLLTSLVFRQVSIYWTSEAADVSPALSRGAGDKGARIPGH